MSRQHKHSGRATIDHCSKRLLLTLPLYSSRLCFQVIDAGPIGNNARFLNHSCAPNCKTELWQVGCQKRVGIFTLRDVKKGEELTYDYCFEGYWQPGAAIECKCGAPNCAGTLGGKKKSKEEMQAKEAAAKGGKAKAKGKGKDGNKSKKRKEESDGAAVGEAPTAKRRVFTKPRNNVHPPAAAAAAAASSPLAPDDSTESESEGASMHD